MNLRGLATEFGSDRMWGLKELPLPEPVSWLPATSGWWLLAALALAIAGGWGLRGYRAWQGQGYRRRALARLSALGSLAELPRVLRTTALAAYPREEVAALRGRAWIAWLNENGGRFEVDDAEWLDRLPYDPGAPGRLPPQATLRLLNASRAWVRSHRARL